jgi:hypothetical protein
MRLPRRLCPRRLSPFVHGTLASIAALVLLGGCPPTTQPLPVKPLIGVDSLTSAEFAAINAPPVLQQGATLDTAGIVPPPNLPAALDNLGDTVALSSDATVIIDLATFNPPPAAEFILLGLQNFTNFDIFVHYTVDGAAQGVLVLDGQMLLIEYPCLNSVELSLEDDFDIGTGDYSGSFDLSTTQLFNPDDFVCGDALVLVFLPDALVAYAQSADAFP